MPLSIIAAERKMSDIARTTGKIVNGCNVGSANMTWELVEISLNVDVDGNDLI